MSAVEQPSIAQAVRGGSWLELALALTSSDFRLVDGDITHADVVSVAARHLNDEDAMASELVRRFHRYGLRAS